MTAAAAARRIATSVWRSAPQGARLREEVFRVRAGLGARLRRTLTTVLALYLLVHAATRLIGSRPTGSAFIYAGLITVLAMVVWHVGRRGTHRTRER